MNVIICMRCSDVDLPVDGSIKSKCSNCNEDVYISKATIEAASNNKEEYEACCFRCINSDDLSEGTIIPPTKDQIKEVISTELRDNRSN